VENHVTAVNKKTVTAEQIIEAGTQVVFYSSSTNQETIIALQEAGIPCVDIGMKTADDLLRAVDIIAEAFGTEYATNVANAYKDKFAYYQDYVKSCVETIPQEDRVSVLVIGDLTDITGFGVNAYEAYWTNAAGVDYILPSNDGADKVNLTMEQVFEFDPDAVVVETFDTRVFTDDSTWLSLRAYKEGRVLAAPSALDNWSKPGAESMMVYLWALNVFYPDYAGNLDLTTEVRHFYKDFYGYDMSEEYAAAVMQGKDIAD
jgi:iron complex transport system substrate-binding protein